MTVSGVATAADYSEAMSVARRAKSVIALLLLLMLLAQVTVFFLARYNVIHLSPADATIATVDAAASDATTQPATSAKLLDLLHYVTGVVVLGGIGLTLVLTGILLLIAHIMLVGRLIGVGKVTSSIVWTLVLVVFLFPWQSFMQTDFRIAGVLWTWQELLAGYDFANDFSGNGWASTIVSWFRFAAAPLIAIVLILVVQLKSNRGIRMAMGEDEVLNELMGQQQ